MLEQLGENERNEEAETASCLDGIGRDAHGMYDRAEGRHTVERSRRTAAEAATCVDRNMGPQRKVDGRPEFGAPAGGGAAAELRGKVATNRDRGRDRQRK